MDGQERASGATEHPPVGLPVVGWKERVSLPDWGIRRLRVKLDTGARSSALHVSDLEEVGTEETEDGARTILRFGIILGRRDDAPRRVVTAVATDWRRVRDTGANAELRPVVRTRIVCGPMDREVDVTLTDRSGMNFRMILGRTTLTGACVVDPGHGYLVTPPPPRAARGPQW
jgi:hypothetical protein